MDKLFSTWPIREIIRSSNNNPYFNPVISVKKKNESWHFCVDYRTLKTATVPCEFLIPIIEKLLDKLHGAWYFSKIDLRSNYYQIRMHREDIQKTTFLTHLHHYDSLVMSFGLRNASAIFQGAMNRVLRTILLRFMLVIFMTC